MPYANLQEFGGTITPKNSKFLSIPSDDPEVRTPAGVTDKYKGARDFINLHPGQTFFAKGKKPDTWLLFWRPTKRGVRERIGPVGRRDFVRTEARLVFILKKSVTIPARFGFRKTWDSLQTKRQDNFKRATDRAVAAAAAGANRA